MRACDGLRLRPVRDRRRLGRREARADVRVVRRARRHCGARTDRRHVRAARLHPEEAARLCLALPARRRGREGLRLDLRRRHARLACADRREGSRDQPAQRHLREPAAAIGRRHDRRARDDRRCAYGRRRRAADSRAPHRDRDRLASVAAAASGHRARDHVARSAVARRAARAHRGGRRRVYRGGVRGHLQRLRQPRRPLLSRRNDPARLRRRRATVPVRRDDEAGHRNSYGRDDPGDRARRRRHAEPACRRSKAWPVRCGAVRDGPRAERRRARTRGGGRRARCARRDRGRRVFGDVGRFDPRDRRRDVAAAAHAGRDARRRAARDDAVRRPPCRDRSRMGAVGRVQPAGSRDGRPHRGARASSTVRSTSTARRSRRCAIRCRGATSAR
ncbi:hypothetical protein FEP93_02434 [Burkholderia multivorans]|nr:hypothetical protein [Burkholderia multivorans]